MPNEKFIKKYFDFELKVENLKFQTITFFVRIFSCDIWNNIKLNFISSIKQENFYKEIKKVEQDFSEKGFR